MPSKRLTVSQRQEIFQELVATQDEVMDVRRSRDIIRGRYEITEHILRTIENEGLDKEWPPLGELVVARSRYR